MDAKELKRILVNLMYVELNEMDVRAATSNEQIEHSFYHEASGFEYALDKMQQFLDCMIMEDEG